MIKKDKLITVIVPAYNAEKTIDKCLKSLVKQSNPSLYEVIIIDDGSTDKTVKKIKKYTDSYSNFSLIEKENTGSSDTRNVGIKQAKSDFITFVDSDDYVEPTYLDSFINQINRYRGIDLYITGYQKETENGEIIFLSHKRNMESIINTSYAQNKILSSGEFEGYTWNKLYKMEIIRNHDIEFDKEISLYEDLVFNLEYLNFCKKISVGNQNVYHYVKHENSIVNSNNFGNNFDIKSVNSINVMENMRKIIPKDNLKAQKNLNAKICWSAVSLYRNLYGAPNYNSIDKKVGKQLRLIMKKYRRDFLNNDILPKRDIYIYWLNWYMPSLFALLWKRLGLHGNG
ncbi:glycosyltransferase family A protein [Lactobacillaceae bacterium 24-114]